MDAGSVLQLSAQHSYWQLGSSSTKTQAASLLSTRRSLTIPSILLWRTFSISLARGSLSPFPDIDHLHEERQRSSGNVVPRTLRCLTREHVWLIAKSLLFVLAIHHPYFFPGPICTAFTHLREIPLCILICNMTTIWTTWTNLEVYLYRPPNDI